jgi:hypothetical protein
MGNALKIFSSYRVKAVLQNVVIAIMHIFLGTEPGFITDHGFIAKAAKTLLDFSCHN